MPLTITWACRRLRDARLVLAIVPGAFGSPGIPRSSVSVSAPDIVSTALDIVVDSAARRLSVQARLVIRNTAATRAFSFMLADSYDHIDVTANGARCRFERPGDGTISVEVPTPDTAIALTFELSGRPTSTSERRSVIGDSTVFLLWSDRFYPADFDDWSTMSIRLTLPSHFRVFAPGVGGEDSTATLPVGSRRWRFVTSQPIRAATIIADRRWTESQAVIGGRRVRTLLYPNERQFAAQLMRESADVLTEYERLFGPYPFESFTFAAVDSIFARRSVAAGVIYAPSYLRQELDSTGRDAHETALLWWGYATAGRGDGSYQWTEGFGDYAEFLYDEARGKPIPRDFLLYRSGYLRTAGTATELTYTNARGPLSGNFIHGRLPFLMHFLRFAVGDSGFRAGLHVLFDRYRYRTFTIDEFVAAMSEGAGRSLAWWKTEWLDRRGVPDLEWSTDDPPDGATSGARVTIEQRGAIYTLPIEIGVETRSGVHIVRVLLDHGRQTFDIPSDGAKPRITIDPNGWLLARINQQPSRTADAQITNQPPTDLQPARNLSAQDRRDNLEALWKAVDVTYAHFELKSIDWDDVGRRYRSLLTDVSSDEEYYRLLSRMIGELKDTHSWLQNYREPPPPHVSSVAVDLFDSKALVVAVAAGSEAEQAGVKPGWEIVSVDGLTPGEKVQALRPLLHGFSSERAFRREATRRLLAGVRATPASIVLRQPGGDTLRVTLPRGPGPTAVRPSPKPGFVLTRATDVEYGVHSSGVGYIRILSFARREELDRAFDAALDAVRNTPSLILDIRDNPGGFSHSWIVGRFLEKRTETVVSIIKNGPAHGAFRTQPGYDRPTGSWQYTGRVALLVNDVTGSAADLFTTELRSTKRVTVLGATTHGNLSGTAAYAVLPCNLVVRISNGYITDLSGRAIEVNGNAPDVVVEPTIDDVLGGRDPVLDRAVALLTGKPRT